MQSRNEATEEKVRGNGKVEGLGWLEKERGGGREGGGSENKASLSPASITMLYRRIGT